MSVPRDPWRGAASSGQASAYASENEEGLGTSWVALGESARREGEER